MFYSLYQPLRFQGQISSEFLTEDLSMHPYKIPIN